MINPIDSHVKYSFFPVEFFAAVILREGNGYFNVIARMSADELLFKVIYIAAGTDSQICSLTLCISAVEFDAVNRTDVIDIYCISVFNGERSI